MLCRSFFSDTAVLPQQVFPVLFLFLNNEVLGTIGKPVIELSSTAALSGGQEVKDSSDFKPFLKSAADNVLPFSFILYPEKFSFQRTDCIDPNNY